MKSKPDVFSLYHQLRYPQLPVLNLPPEQQKVSKNQFQNRTRFVTKTHNSNRGKKTEALAHSNSCFPFLLKQHNEAITVRYTSRAVPAKAIGWAARRGLEVWHKGKKQLLPDMIH